MPNFYKPLLAILGLGLLTSTAAHAQLGVGTGNTAPRSGTMLDVNGPIASYETIVAATGTTTPTAAITGNVGQVQLTTGTAAAGPITVSYANTPIAGQRLVIYNTAAYPARFNSQDIPATQVVEFVYSASGWRASAGGGNGTMAGNGLTKTGNSIALGGALTQATTSVSGVDATHTLAVTGTSAATFINTAAISPTPNVTTRALGLQGNFNGSSGTGGTHLSFLEGSGVETGRVASVQEPGDWYIGVGISTSNGTAGTVTERMRVAAGGNVGIGTSAPTYRLEIHGNSEADIKPLIYGTTSSTNNPGFFLYMESLLSPARLVAGSRTSNTLGQSHSTGNSAITSFVYNGNNNADNFVSLGLFGKDDILNVTGARTVGINVANPTNTLDVNGTARVRNIPLNGGTNMLTVDNNGVINKQALPAAAAPTLVANGGSAGISMSTVPVASPSTSTYSNTGFSVTIPAGGKYAVQIYQLLRTGSGTSTYQVPAGQAAWFHATLADNATATAESADIVGGKYISGIFSASMPYNMMSGVLIVQNPNASSKTYYFAIQSVQNSGGLTATMTELGRSFTPENQMIAIPIN